MRLAGGRTAAIIVVAFALLVSCLAALPGCLSPAAVEAQDSFLVTKFVGKDGREIAAITISGKPSGSSSEVVDTPEPEVQMGTNVLSDVPAFDWSYGCSATSAAMLFGYYDRIGYSNIYTGPTNGGVCPLDNSIWGDTVYPGVTCHECPLSATRLGVDNCTSKGHVDDYWIDYNSSSQDPYISGGWTEHTQGDCTGDFMGTNQSRLGNNDGATTFYYYTSGDPLYNYQPSDPNRRDGCYGMGLFAESRGYTVIANFNQYIQGKGTNPSKGFTFSDFVDEIDAGRPVLIQVEGHTMLGFGYDTSSNKIYICDTWDHATHQMTWGSSYAGMEHYGVSVIRLTDPTLPLVATDDASDVSDTFATLNGDLTSLGTALSVEVSFQWGTSSESYSNNTSPQTMSTTGSFNFDLSDLNPGTTYYYRAMAVGSASSYGAQRSFTTSTTPPSVVTDSATNITINSARLNGNLISLGSASSNDVSFEWGVDPGSYPNETTPQTITTAGSFTFDLTELNPGTTYHFRAKAVGDGTSYGNEESLVTSTTPPSVVTNNATGITETTARFNGNLTSLGTASSANMSFEWGISPGHYSDETTLQTMTATGSFSFNLHSLIPGTTYYYRSKAVGDGMGYGLEKSFATLTIPPSVTTLDVTEIAISSARLNGHLVSLGSASTVSVSFEWGTNPGSYSNENTPQTMAFAGAFSVDLPDLAPGTTYYFRAKAVGHGTSYGAERSFTTSTTPPSVTTSAVTEITTSSARLHGNLTSPGTASALYVSYQWGTEPGFYSNETLPQTMAAAETFSCDVTGLNPGTTYYFRAKAVGDGIAYGLEKSFTTLTLPPSVATWDASDLTVDSATLNGNLTSLGTATNVNVSFEWGASSGSYDEQTATLSLATAGAVSFDLTGLNPGTTYYFRAIAVGHHGTVYGAEGIFTTLTIPPSVTIEDAMDITEEVATLNANLVSLGTAETVNISFLWGTIQGGPYVNETISQTMTSAGTVRQEIDGLIPGTTYYCVAEVSGGGVVCSTEESFTTLPSTLSENAENAANDPNEVEVESSAHESAGVLAWVGAALALGIAALLFLKALHR